MANAANRAQQEREELKRQFSSRAERQDFLWMMNDPRGRRFLWRMLGHCKVFQPVFNSHGGVMNFNEGQRNVGLFLLGEINRLCPDLYAVAAAENAPQPEDTEEVTNDD